MINPNDWFLWANGCIARVEDRKLKLLHRTLEEMAPIGQRIIEQIEAKERREP